MNYWFYHHSTSLALARQLVRTTSVIQGGVKLWNIYALPAVPSRISANHSLYTISFVKLIAEIKKLLTEQISAWYTCSHFSAEPCIMAAANHCLQGPCIVVVCWSNWWQRLMYQSTLRQPWSDMACDIYYTASLNTHVQQVHNFCVGRGQSVIPNSL